MLKPIAGLFIFILILAFNPGHTQDVKLVDFEEFQSYLNKDNDTLYILNFWATWCKPCVEEMPAFEQVNEEYQDEKVKVILVSLDFPDQMDSRLRKYMKLNDIRSQVILLDEPDANKWIDLVSPAWSGAIPGTLFYRGNQRSFYEKSFSYSELKQIIQSF